MEANARPWTEPVLLERLRRSGAPGLRRLRFRENRSTIWSITGGGTRLNLHAAYRHAPEDVVLHFAVLVRELVRGARRGAAYRGAAEAVRTWPGVRRGLERARRRPGRRSRRAGGRRRRRSESARPGPCCATAEQRAWLGALYRQLARTRFAGDLPGDVPVRLSRRMTSRLGHMRGDTLPGPLRRRTVVEIALSLDLMLPGNEAELLDTLLHEMAHAADWLEHGGRGHDERWKKLARRAGCADRARCAAPLRRRRGVDEAVTRVPAVPPSAFARHVAGAARD